MLNSRKYVDVTFVDYSGKGLNIASITDSDPEISFSGAGVGDVAISSVEQLAGGTTFRYHLADNNSTNKVDLFKAGAVSFQYIAGSWADKDGKTNTAKTETFTVIDGGATSSNKGTKLGPITLEGPSIVVEDFNFDVPEEGESHPPRLLVMVGLRVERATIDFGGGTNVEMKGLLGAFELAIELPLSWEASKPLASSRLRWIHCSSKFRTD